MYRRSIAWTDTTIESQVAPRLNLLCQSQRPDFSERSLELGFTLAVGIRNEEGWRPATGALTELSFGLREV